MLACFHDWAGVMGKMKPGILAMWTTVLLWVLALMAGHGIGTMTPLRWRVCLTEFRLYTGNILQMAGWEF